MSRRAESPLASSSSRDMELVTTHHFDPASLSVLDEPVQRYVNHALAAPGAVMAGSRRARECRA